MTDQAPPESAPLSGFGLGPLYGHRLPVAPPAVEEADDAVGVLTLSAGATHLTSTPDDRWALSFARAAITMTGPAIPALALRVSASFLPEDGHATSELLTARAGGPANFTAYDSPLTTSTLTYAYAFRVAPNGRVAISDGSWFATAGPDAASPHGTFVLTVSAPGYQASRWSLHDRRELRVS